MLNVSLENQRVKLIVSCLEVELETLIDTYYNYEKDLLEEIRLVVETLKQFNYEFSNKVNTFIEETKLFTKLDEENLIIIDSLISRLDYCLDLLYIDKDTTIINEMNLVVSSLKRFNYNFENYHSIDYLKEYTTI